MRVVCLKMRRKWAVVPEKVSLGPFSRQHLLQARLKKVALVRLFAIFFAAAVILCLKLKEIGVLIQSCCNNGPEKGSPSGTGQERRFEKRSIETIASGSIFSAFAEHCCNRIRHEGLRWCRQGSSDRAVAACRVIANFCTSGGC